MVEEPEFVIVAGLNEAVAPVGNPPTLKFTLPTNPVPPVTVMAYGAFAPCITELRVGNASTVKSGTVIMTDGGWGSVIPCASVTVKVATCDPGIEYVTAPGFWRLLELGMPSKKDHREELIVLRVDVPGPAKETDPPALTVTLEAGLVMVPVGGTSVGAVEICTMLAREGTPELFRMKSM